MSFSSVVADINTIHQRWIHSYLVDFDQAKAKELAHINALEVEYWSAWKKSQAKLEEMYSEQIKDVQGASDEKLSPHYQRTRVKKIEKSRDGNAAYLQGIQWCIEQRCKILGLNQFTQNINVNWRKQAEEAGIDPDGAVNDLVQQFLEAASVGRSDGAGGVGKGTEDPAGS